MQEGSDAREEGDLFSADGKGGKGGAEERKEERKREFLSIMSEDDIKRKHNDSLEELRKSKR